jgi:hypothetical protein
MSWIAAAIFLVLAACAFFGWPDFILPSLHCTFLFFVAALVMLPPVWRGHLSGRRRRIGLLAVALLVVLAFATMPFRTHAVMLAPSFSASP